MDAILEEKIGITFLSGNDGNTGNSNLNPNNTNDSSDDEVLPSINFYSGNNCEQIAIDRAVPAFKELPTIPDYLKTVEIDEETVLMSAIWEYRDEQTNTLCFVQRFDPRKGKKQFRPLTFVRTESEGRWTRKAPPEPRPLYGLDRLAARPEVDVLVCEGEKSADAASRLFPDKVAITSMNGAQSPEKTDWSPLKGRNVILWRDFDESGMSYVAEVERLVTVIGAKVTHTIRPEWFLEQGKQLGIIRETLSEGWDAADAEQEGFTSENIITFLEQEKVLEIDNNLFTNTASQHDSILDEMVQSHGNEQNSGTAPAGKSSMKRDLFKDSEFEVIEFFKGYKNGVYWCEPVGEDDEPRSAIFLCTPMIVVAETRDTEQSNWGRLLSWEDNDGHAHFWACPVEMLAATDTAEFRRELSRNGLTIATNSKARQKLADYVLGYKPQSQDRVRCVTKTGWHGTRYVLSNGVYGNQQGESVIYQGVTNGDFSVSGTLPDWQREIALRAVGNSRIVFAIATAFAGPLVEFANEPGGGFQFTGDTSKGKTSSVIDPAASVWGHPDKFAKKWRTTANGLEAMCLSRNHSTLMLDDLGQSDAKDCGQAAYLIANGQGKARMQKEGGNRPLSTWKTMILSSGEIDITQHMSEAGKVAKGGQIARLPSIPADAGAGMFVLECLHDQPDGRHFSDTMKAVTREYYGSAGDAFLKQLADPLVLNEIKETIRSGITEIIKLMNIPPDAAPEVGRVAARFALVAFAGELATRFGVTDWAKGESIKAATRCYADWFLNSGGAMGADKKVLLDQVSAFLQAHGASRFPPHDVLPDELPHFQNRAGFSYNDGEAVHYWVESGAFKRELCKGFNHSEAAKNLIHAGWLVPGSDRNQQKNRIKALGGKPISFYVISDKALGGEL